MVRDLHRNRCLFRADLGIRRMEGAGGTLDVGRTRCLLLRRPGIGKDAGGLDGNMVRCRQAAKAHIAGLFRHIDAAVLRVGIQPLGSTQVIQPYPVVNQVYIHGPYKAFLALCVQGNLAVNLLGPGKNIDHHAGGFFHLLCDYGLVLGADAAAGVQTDVFAGDMGSVSRGKDAAALYIQIYISPLGFDVFGGEVAGAGNDQVNISVIVKSGHACADTDFPMERAGFCFAGILRSGCFMLPNGFLEQFFPFLIGQQFSNEPVQVFNGLFVGFAAGLDVQQLCQEFLLFFGIRCFQSGVDGIHGTGTLLQNGFHGRFRMVGVQEALLLLLRKAVEHSQILQQLFPLLVSQNARQGLAVQFRADHGLDRHAVQRAVEREVHLHPFEVGGHLP